MITGVDSFILSWHKKILFYCWGWGTDVAIIFARFGKMLKFYISIHEILMIGICLLTCFFELIVVYQNYGALGRDKLTDNNAYIHYILGLIFIVIFST